MNVSVVILRGTRGNVVPIVKKLPKSMGTAFPLLKCLRTPKCTILQDFACILYNLKNFPGWYSRKSPLPQFPHGSPAFALFLFYETTTDTYDTMLYRINRGDSTTVRYYNSKTVNHCTNIVPQHEHTYAQ